MAYGLQSCVVYHFVVVQIEQFVQLKYLLPIDELKQTHNVAV
jgi:hypothetical protein